MTANQMVVLLQIYRGDENPGDDCGTTVDDLACLHHHGLIVRAFVSQNHEVIQCPAEGDRWTTTAKGDDLVRNVLSHW